MNVGDSLREPAVVPLGVVFDYEDQDNGIDCIERALASADRLGYMNAQKFIDICSVKRAPKRHDCRAPERGL